LSGHFGCDSRNSCTFFNCSILEAISIESSGEVFGHCLIYQSNKFHKLSGSALLFSIDHVLNNHFATFSKAELLKRFSPIKILNHARLLLGICDHVTLSMIVN
jgi:hypothetical protein